MAVIHISEAEVAGDVPGLVARVLAGEEIVIDSKAGCVKVVPAAAPVGRPISEIIERLDAREKERGFPLYMDDDFADDMEEIIRNHKAVEPVRPRTTAEAIAIGEAREKGRGYKAAMDEDFARDLEEIIANRKPANWPEWD